MNCCCKKISDQCIEFKEFDQKPHSILYDKTNRIYFINHLDHDKDTPYCTHVYFCPWCGTKFPDDLREKWFDVLEEEYGITDPQDIEYDKVPPEFRTDEWWIKRGL